MGSYKEESNWDKYPESISRWEHRGDGAFVDMGSSENFAKILYHVKCYCIIRI